MKRRNVDVNGKLRRPVKRSKLGEGILGSTTFVYLKFLLVWVLVLLADFVLEFRFEYLWPFWLLLRSVYDSFKYQGLAFSVFFVFVALTSDMICFLFIPVHWLFFAASTYVWVQYVWHLDRGICLPTVSLWLLFVYIEASVRLKELKSLPFHLDLCRPFAAHCIGYPVVTLTFGFKSYVSYRMRLRRQKEVAKENEFYVELLQQALPKEAVVQPPPPAPCLVESLTTQPALLANGSSTQIMANGQNHHQNGITNSGKKQAAASPTRSEENGKQIAVLGHSNHHHSSVTSGSNSKLIRDEYDAKKNSTQNGIDKHELQYMEHQIIKKMSSVNDFDEESQVVDSSHKNSFKSITASLTSVVSNSTKANHQLDKTSNNPQQSNCSVSPSTADRNSSNSTNSPSQNTSNSTKWHQNHDNSNHLSHSSNGTPSVSNGTVVAVVSSTNGPKKAKNLVTNNLLPQKDENTLRLEADIKRLKADLQASRQTEQELRGQLTSLSSGERGLKVEVCQLQQDNENLQTKLHNLVTARQQDKQNIGQLEKKLIEEKKCKAQLDSQLAQERKNKKAEEVATARALALATQARSGECTDSCKSKRRESENDLKQMKRELKLREEQIRQIDREAQSLRQYKDSHGDTEILMSALSAMQDKNAHLENSLSAETRLKLDLFSALGDTKRQLEISQAVLNAKEQEVDDLKSKIAEVMAVMPPTTSSYSSLENSLVSSILYNSKNLFSSLSDCSNGSSTMDALTKAALDPNASSYSPQCKGINDL